jgi:hypothetical protein
LGDGEDLQNVDIFPIPVHELAEIDGEVGQDDTAEAQESEEVDDDGEQEAYFDGEAEEGLFRDMRLENSGADEWAFYGWFKFEVPEKFPLLPITVFRAVFNNPATPNELNMAKNLGDQTLGVYIANGNIDFCIGKTGENIADIPDPKYCVSSSFGNDLPAWIWFYAGYSRKLQRMRYFVRYEDHSWSTVSENILQILPHWSGAYIGGDPFFEPFKGYVRNVEALFGPDSYIEGNLDSLVEHSPPREILDAMKSAFGDDLAFILKESRAKSDEYIYKLEIPPNLLDDVYSVSFSFWFRMSTQIPEKQLDISYLRENQHIMLARAFDTEIGNYDSQQKERMLAVYIQQGKIVFGSFD